MAAKLVGQRQPMPSRRSRENDFDERTKRLLANRAGHACSRCRVPTTAASADHMRAVNNIGVAAHIRGARPGSCRYDAGMSEAERSGIENGIWLCQKCAKLVDGDAATWTPAKLYELKFAAEQRATAKLGKRQRRGKAVKFTLGGCFYAEQFQAAFVFVRIANEDSRAVTVESAHLIVGGVEYEASDPISSVIVGDRELLQRPPMRLAGRDAAQGAWVFRRMVECHFQDKSRPTVLVTKIVGRRARRHVIVRDGNGAGPSASSAYIPDDGSVR